MLNPAGHSSFKIYTQTPNSPFLQLPLLQPQPQLIFDASLQQQQQQQLAGQFIYAQNQQQQQFQQQQQQQQNQQQQLLQLNNTNNGYSNTIVSASQLDDCESGSNSDGDSQQVLNKNPEQVRGFFEEFLKNTQTVDCSTIQLSAVNEQYNITFRSMPSDEEIKAEFNRMLQKFNSSSQKGQKKNWNDNETKILCWIVIMACALQNLDCRNIEDKIWDDIAKMMIGRTSESCKFKWLSLSKLNLQQIPWSTEEDQLLLSIIKDYNASNKGNKWSEISKELNSKSKKNVFRQGKQCRERWNNHLDPAINRGPWSDKEDLCLLQLIIEKGKKWSDVSKELRSNRTENNVKNRFNSILKKEKQTIDEQKGPKNETALSEMEIINLLIKKYTLRISSGFTLNCKEEESTPKDTADQQCLLRQSESPGKKIEKQKNKLKDLVQSEIKTKENQQYQQQKSQSSSLSLFNVPVSTSNNNTSSSMVLEETNKANSINSFGIFTDDQQRQQQFQQQQQQSFPQIQQNGPFYFVSENSFSPNSFQKSTSDQPQQQILAANSLSPNNNNSSNITTPLQSSQQQQQQQNLALFQLFSASNGQYIGGSPQSTNQLTIQAATPSSQFTAAKSQFQNIIQQQQQQEITGQFKVKNATELLCQPEAAQNLSLAFFNTNTQELVEIDPQLLEDYTQQQVRMQLHQYSQNIKSSQSQIATPLQTPQQTPQSTFQIMFQQMANQGGSNSPQYSQLYQKVNCSPVILGQNLLNTNNAAVALSQQQQQQQQFMGMMGGTPLSPSANFFQMLPSISPGASGYNTPNENNNNTADIRSINQMQQYANFFQIRHPTVQAPLSPFSMQPPMFVPAQQAAKQVHSPPKQSQFSSPFLNQISNNNNNI